METGFEATKFAAMQGTTVSRRYITIKYLEGHDGFDTNNQQHPNIPTG